MCNITSGSTTSFTGEALTLNDRILESKAWADELQAIIDEAPEKSEFLTYEDINPLFKDREVIFYD